MCQVTPYEERNGPSSVVLMIVICPAEAYMFLSSPPRGWKDLFLACQSSQPYHIAEVSVLQALKKTIARILEMKDGSWWVFLRCLQLCVFLLLCSWALFLSCHGDYPGNLERYISAVSLYETGQIVLLIGVILPVCLEDLPGRG